ncbi:HotDog domain-containing protein [Syncephalastrum racemosum]|uniref:HotDog domain-containing protein n=1 Tax=Syncephalastrum racemosum TaxID=13706 RepID=A0A1X2HMD7_SYNRA|nr:HotDog domain-containing protein [Syncephalastrum racemosum]
MKPNAKERLSLINEHLKSTHENASDSPGPSSRASLPSTFRNRNDYKYFLSIQSRWSDNDQYGHINNSVYYFYIDTVVNEYLLKHCGLDPLDTSNTKPKHLVASSWATFYASAAYPSLFHVGLCITKIGRSSVAYRLGIFEGDQSEACVVGGYTHVFIDPIRRRPLKELPSWMRAGMEPIIMPQSK